MGKKKRVLLFNSPTSQYVESAHIAQIRAPSLDFFSTVKSRHYTQQFGG